MQYTFNQNCKVYLVSGSSRYKIEVYPDLTFSQTFNEKAIKVKTLHDQNAMFENAVINQANPADFSFTVLLVKDSDFDVIGDWLTTSTGLDEALTTYDVYVDTGVDIFKIQKAVLGRGTFQIAKDSLITVSLQGTGSRLTRFGPSGATIPGVPVIRDLHVSPVLPRAVIIELDGTPLLNIAGVSLEIANNISWLDHNTLHKSLYVSSASEESFPEAFVVSGKVLSGTIRQFLTSDNSTTANSWSTNSSLRIRIVDNEIVYLDVNIPSVVYTNRIEPSQVFMQNYDFRMTHNPNQVYNILKYKE